MNKNLRHFLADTFLTASLVGCVLPAGVGLAAQIHAPQESATPTPTKKPPFSPLEYYTMAAGSLVMLWGASPICKTLKETSTSPRP